MGLYIRADPWDILNGWCLSLVETYILTSHVGTLKSAVHVSYAGYDQKLKLLYKISELSLDIFFLETFLLEPSYVTLRLILWDVDQVCHSYLIFITCLISICSSLELHHLLADLIYSLI